MVNEQHIYQWIHDSTSPKKAKYPHVLMFHFFITVQKYYLLQAM